MLNADPVVSVADASTTSLSPLDSLGRLAYSMPCTIGQKNEAKTTPCNADFEASIEDV